MFKLVLLLLVINYSLIVMSMSESSFQHPLTSDASQSSSSWQVQISTNWDVLGPFPIHAREQHFLSPSFPLNLSEPIDYTRTWPSSCADGGSVSWGSAQADDNGSLRLSFPHIRWKSLRATEGWAALQHHAVLRTSLTVYPPSRSIHLDDTPHLRVQLKQGSYFTVLPKSNGTPSSTVPQWYAGNIYDMEGALPRAVSFPVPPAATSATQYDLFVSGDYEIRVFGDPHARGSEIPVQTISVHAEIETNTQEVVHEPSQDVVCDFVDGFTMGDALGIGIRSIDKWWTVTDVLSENAKGVELQLLRPTRIAPSQMRVIPVSIVQDHPIRDNELELSFVMASGNSSRVLSVLIPIRHRRLPLTGSRALKASYFYANCMPTIFLAVPPLLDHPRKNYPPILALHGAGVDVTNQPFWAESLPKNNHNWIIIPTGRTSWGLDWHGPSANDAWASVDALVSVLAKNKRWDALLLPETPSVVVIGHSNGGQGTWYLASRFPDRVIGAIPAAAYLKSQAYVPLSWSRSAHFIDPSLRAILESSLTPDDNDLHFSNLVDTPILAIHGGDDENVPVWHSREAVQVVKSRSPEANVTFLEDEGQGHWYPSVFKKPQVQEFLEGIYSKPIGEQKQANAFTLTVSVPKESGAFHGWRILKLAVPGRLGKLCIETPKDFTIRVITSNVKMFSVNSQVFDIPGKLIQVDGATISVPHDVNSTWYFVRSATGSWEMASGFPDIQASSRIQSILSSKSSILLVIPGETSGGELSLVLRIAHDLACYHKLDADIILEGELPTALNSSSRASGNIVFIGTSSSAFVSDTLKWRKTPFTQNESQLLLHSNVIEQNGKAIIFLHPHPIDPEASVLFMLHTGPSALERAGRLFPIRTGVAVSDWIITGSSADLIGAGGVEGAGVWGADWGWNEPLSWLF